MLTETLPIPALTHSHTRTRLSPLVRELPADLETPTSVYLKLRGRGPSFLLESVEGGERVARYSFVGVEPGLQYRLRGNAIERRAQGQTKTIPVEPGADPLHVLQAELSRFSDHLARPAIASEHVEGLPRFIGGLVGYLGYETIRYFEPKLVSRLAPGALPEAMFLLADTLVAFDHVRRSLFLIVHAFDGDEAEARRKLDNLEARLHAPMPPPQFGRPAAVRASRRSSGVPPQFRRSAEVQASNYQSQTQSNLTQAAYESMVRAAKEHIAAGDIFQVVLSQRLARQTTAQPFDIYRALRRLNPSPYMFYFDFGEVDGQPFYLVGASPEMFVRLEGRLANLRPIAGTRPRGASPAADTELQQELLADVKERAEHVMLVDLGRNDLGRVCAYGSIHVPEFFAVERYSHVMHLVSHVEGLLRPDLSAFDLVRAAFPAGTVSGAPKVRAMEIIGNLEAGARGPYAGAVGYFGFDGTMDTCLAIRTLVGHGTRVSVQAGAGIVADSDPTREYEETLNKARAVLRAIEIAEEK